MLDLLEAADCLEECDGTVEVPHADVRVAEPAHAEIHRHRLRPSLWSSPRHPSGLRCLGPGAATACENVIGCPGHRQFQPVPCPHRRQAPPIHRLWQLPVRPLAYASSAVDETVIQPGVVGVRSNEPTVAAHAAERLTSDISALLLWSFVDLPPASRHTPNCHQSRCRTTDVLSCRPRPLRPQWAVDSGRLRSRISWELQPLGQLRPRRNLLAHGDYSSADFFLLVTEAPDRLYVWKPNAGHDPVRDPAYLPN